jgi:hypothetical protein
MKKAKYAMILVLLIFFIQETGLTYQGNFESLIEYSTEKSESREECLFRNLIRAESKKVVAKSLWQPNSRDPHFELQPPRFFKPLNRTILYRTLLI